MSATLGWFGRWWSRLMAGLALAVVAGVTGFISYTHIYWLTLALHQPESVARIYAFGVDGLIVVGSVILLQAAMRQPWLGWLGVVPGVAASLFANAESGIRYGWLAAIWAGVPAVSFALATFMLERWLKAQASQAAQPVQDGSPEPEAEKVSADPGPDAGDGSEPDEPLTPEAALLALIGTGSRRDIAELLGVPKSRVDRWAARLAQPVQAGPDDTSADEYWVAEEAPESSPYGPVVAVPRLRRTDMNGSEPA